MRGVGREVVWGIMEIKVLWVNLGGGRVFVVGRCRALFWYSHFEMPAEEPSGVTK